MQSTKTGLLTNPEMNCEVLPPPQDEAPRSLHDRLVGRDGPVYTRGHLHRGHVPIRGRPFAQPYS